MTPKNLCDWCNGLNVKCGRCKGEGLIERDELTPDEFKFRVKIIYFLLAVWILTVFGIALLQ